MGGVVAIMAGLIPLSALAELVNIGTLFAFVVVSAGVMIHLGDERKASK